MCHCSWSNQALDTLSPSKWLFESQFCERCLCSWQKNGQKWSWNGHLWVINFLSFFLQNCKKLETKKKVFYVVNFDLIRISKCWASQNDGQILNYVKPNNVVGKKLPETVLKCPTPSVVRFISDQSLGRKKLDTKLVLKSVAVYDYTVGKGWDHLDPCISKLE